MLNKKKKYGKQGSRKKRYTVKIPMWFLALPFLIGAGIVPALVRGRSVQLYEKALELWPTNNGMVVDFFSFQKAAFTILAGVAAFVLLLVKKNGEGISENKYNLYVIPVLSYSFFVILSTLLSEYPKTSFNGFPDRYEGLTVLLSYMLLFLAAMFALDKEERIRTVLWCIILPSFIVLGIGAFQYFNMDFYRTDIGMRIILNANMYAQKENLNFTFQPGVTYTTLFNPNYVGSYCALLLPTLAGMFVYEKKVLHKIVLALAFVLSAINLYGSKSTAGLVGLLMAFVFIVFMLIISWLRKHPVAIVAYIVACVLAVGAFAYINMTDYKGWGIIPDLKVDYIGDEPWFIHDMAIMPQKIYLNMTSGYLEIHNDGGAITFFDENGTQLQSKFDGKQYKLEDPRFSRMIFKLEYENLVLTVYPKSSASFSVYLDESGFYDLIGPLGNPASYGKSDVWIFEGYERVGSSRGYIWGRTLPLMFSERPLFGSGPDTFAYVFPQNDVLGKMNANFSTNRTLVDKPHNMYLQTGINTGWSSLIALLALFVIYFFHSIRLYWRIAFKEKCYFLGLTLAGGCIGYMITGLFNDSTVSVAPLFWVLLGCSVSLNMLVKKQLDRNQVSKVDEV